MSSLDRSPPNSAVASEEWEQVVSSTFEHLGEVAPRLNVHALLEEFITAGALDEGTFREQDLSAVGIAKEVSGALRKGPHVAVAPWGRSSAREVREVDWLAHVDAWGEHLLGIVVPSSVLSGRRVSALWKALPVQMRPVVVLTGRNWFPFLHSQLETSLLVSPTALICRCGCSGSLIAFPPASGSRMTSAFGGSKVGRPASVTLCASHWHSGASLNFERHDPTALARAADLSAFGETREVSELFEVLRSGGGPVRMSEMPSVG